MPLDRLLLAVTLTLYLAASLAYHGYVLAGSEGARRWAVGFTAGAVAMHTAAIGAWCLLQGALLTHPGMIYSVIAFLVGAAQVIANFAGRWVSLGALSMPLAFLLNLVAISRTAAAAPEVEASHPLLRPHVMVLLLAFAVLALAFCLAILYLAESRMLKQREPNRLSRRLPPLESLSHASHWLAVIGFSLLTLGIISGAVAAPGHWGPGWYLDPRTLLTLLAWLVYGVYIGASYFLGWRGRRTTYFLIGGFLILVLVLMLSINRGEGDQTVGAAAAAVQI